MISVGPVRLWHLACLSQNHISCSVSAYKTLKPLGLTRVQAKCFFYNSVAAITPMSCLWECYIILALLQKRNTSPEFESQWVSIYLHIMRAYCEGRNRRLRGRCAVRRGRLSQNHISCSVSAYKTLKPLGLTRVQAKCFFYNSIAAITPMSCLWECYIILALLQRVTISNYGWQQSEIAEILRVSASLLYIFNIP